MVATRQFRLLWLSIAAACATIALKTLAWALTGSVGLLSDAAESVVNLVAAIVALAALYWASKPADEEHAYGHAKAEYFSAGIEGTLILLAALSIAVAAGERLLHPQGIEEVGLGLAISAGASLINLVVGLMLLRSGQRERSIVLEADGKHLLTDVWTSAGVIVGVALVAITGWDRLDPIVALVVAANIVFTGAILIRRSAGGLMDRALEEDQLAAIEATLGRYERQGLEFHALRTRRAGHRAFISVHVLVPGEWTVRRGHDAVEEVEAAVRAEVPGASVFTHLEPVEDPVSFEDASLDRPEPSRPQP